MPDNVPSPTRTDGGIDDGPQLELERFLPYRLSVAANRVSRAFAQRYQTAFGLSIPEWRVMAVLGRFAPCSSLDICERTAMDKAKVSRAVSRLVAAGLIARGAHPADQRLNRLALSRKGRSVYERIVPLALALENEVLEGLTAEERRTLDDLLSKIEERVRRMDSVNTGDSRGTG